MKCKRPIQWTLTSEEDWYKMILGTKYKQAQELQTNNHQFLPDKITSMQINKYEADRKEILANNDHYSQGVTETLEANDRLIIKEARRLYARTKGDNQVTE